MSIKGAIDKKTGKYTSPFLANKCNKYDCIVCCKEVILCDGEVNDKHFRHLIKGDCDYLSKVKYIEPKKIVISDIDELEKQNKENESEYHKQGKILIKQFLENGYKIIFKRLCGTGTKACIKHKIIETKMFCDNSTLEIECHMKYNGNSIYIDLAHLVNGEVKMIYEIYYTHRTAEHNRPDNIEWVDIKVSDIFDEVRKIDDNKRLQLTCSRPWECDECKKYIIELEEQKRIEEEEERRIRIEILEQKRKQQLEEGEQKKQQMLLKLKKMQEEDEVARKNQEEEDRIIRIKMLENERILKIKKEEERKRMEIIMQQNILKKELKDVGEPCFTLWKLKTKTLRGSAKCLYKYKLIRYLGIYLCFNCCENDNGCNNCSGYRNLYKDFFINKYI